LHPAADDNEPRETAAFLGLQAAIIGVARDMRASGRVTHQEDTPRIDADRGGTVAMTSEKYSTLA
jgi:hypothetical protein